MPEIINKKYLTDFFLVISIFLITFPKIEPNFGIGLDASYKWALNWLFANDYNTLIHLIYPIGPLGFLKMPTTEGENLIFALLLQITLRLLFIVLLLKIDRLDNPKQIKPTTLLIPVAAYFANIDLVITGSCFILCVLYLKKNNNWLFLFGAILAFTGLFIKSAIGIISLSIIGLTLIVSYIQTRNTRGLVKQTLIIIGTAFVVGMLIFKDFSLWLNYLWGILKLSGGFSETLSLHPKNNWILLSLFLITLITYPILLRQKKVRTAYFLFLFPLFATWKHAISREDSSHYNILINFMFVFSCIIFLLSYSEKWWKKLLLPLSILVLYGNLSTLYFFKQYRLKPIGISNFTEPIFNYSKFKEQYQSISKERIAKNHLPTDVRNLIQDAAIDIYPWDHSYVPANNLNWQPRITLELGASTSAWASSKAAENYQQTETAPEFVLLHLQKDKYNGRFGSIDGRYLLNDEPEVIYNLFNNYTLERKNESFLLFEKDTSNQFTSVIEDKPIKTNFGKWITLPESDNTIIRLKVHSHNTLAGYVTKFLYKEAEYFIDYLFASGKMITYRYVPSTATEGLWCYPFVQFPASNQLEEEVVKVRLRNSNSFCIANEAETQFEFIHLNLRQHPQESVASRLFQKSIKPDIDTIIRKEIDFAGEKKHNQQQSNSPYKKQPSSSKGRINAGGFSPLFKTALDSLWSSTDTGVSEIMISASVKYINMASKANLVFQVSESDNDFWESAQFLSNATDSVWEYAYINRILSKEKNPAGMFRAYVWNNGDNEVLIDDIKIEVCTLTNTK